jgi:serine protease Do
LLVTEVAPGSPGAEAGIKPGDAIVEVNRRPVADAAAFRQIAAALKPGESIPLYLQRGGGRNEYVMLTAPRP